MLSNDVQVLVETVDGARVKVVTPPAEEILEGAKVGLDFARGDLYVQIAN